MERQEVVSCTGSASSDLAKPGVVDFMMLLILIVMIMKVYVLLCTYNY